MKNQHALTIQSINEAATRIHGVVRKTPLEFSKRLSDMYGAQIYLKREDLQEVRSYKIRGAYALISMLLPQQRKKGVVCASAGNHAQGVALSCARLKVKGTIFMPTIAPLQKINRVKYFGGEWVQTRIVGDTFDEAKTAAEAYAAKTGAVFAHAFDDLRIMSGQGTVGKEIADEIGTEVNMVIIPVGGGGLIAGAATYLKTALDDVTIVSVEPRGAPGMTESIRRGRVVTLKEMDSFVDGAAIRTIGRNAFNISRHLIDRTVVVPEGAVCTTMIDLYQNDGIVAEPAGALSVAALDKLKGSLRGKTVVCVLSGGNNDILRYPEIMERSLIYQGLKHYFIIEFVQKPGQLRRLLNDALGPTDDIVRFEYLKKSYKETGPALVGIELAKKEDLRRLLSNLRRINIRFRKIEISDPVAGLLL